MAGFSEHDKIAGMAGIPGCISDEINRFIDDINPPVEFEKHNTERKIFVCGHLNMSIRDVIENMNSVNNTLRDRGKKEWVQMEDLKWLLATRKEYIKCYYLHLAVDNIYDNKERIKTGRETINDCINRWEEKYAVIIPGAEPYLKDVLEFLRNNIEKIRQIVFLDIDSNNIKTEKT